MKGRKGNTAGQHAFAQVPSINAPRSSYSRSHGLKTTFDSGLLVPLAVDDILPGDTVSMNVTLFARLATPLHPLMDNMKLDVFWFFVPNRLVWDDWAKFMGEQTDPGDSIDFTIPTMSSPAGGYLVGSLQDYFGLPTDIEAVTHQALPFRAYNLIYNEWFRDENLIDSENVAKGAGPDGLAQYSLLKSGKRHDYFTSCLPFAQKGDGVGLGIGSTAPVVFPTNMGIIPFSGLGPTWKGITTDDDLGRFEGGQGVTNEFSSENAMDATPEFIKWNTTNLAGNAISMNDAYADLSSATAASINQLREAFQIQRLLERDARSGTRLTEIIKGHWGVDSPDMRLQRPEYLGGGTVDINVNPVPQTSGTIADVAVEDDDTPQGNLAAYGVGSGSGNGFTKSFTEHGHIIGIVRARADLNYQQGLDRMWSRSTRYDFFWPEFAMLGEQSVLNKEIYAQGDLVLNGDSPPTPIDNDVFGYQERWAEYRYKPSKITGLFRSTAAGSLDTWHLAQEFTSLPTLGKTFIEEDVPMARVIAVPSEPHFIMDAWFQYTHARLMPTRSVPGMIDHF